MFRLKGRKIRMQDIAIEEVLAKRTDRINTDGIHSERKEFGLAQILMSESELSFVRPYYKYIPRMPFVKYADFTAQTVVRITERELGNLNVYRHAHGEQEITLNRNQAFMDAMPTAGRRYEEYMAKEIVKKDARLHYHDVLRVIREHALDVGELSQVLEL